MNRVIFIFFLTMTGIFLIPRFSVACNMHSGKKAECCHSGVEKQNQPLAKVAQLLPVQMMQTCDDGDHGCNHSACECPTISVVVALLYRNHVESIIPFIEKDNALVFDTGISSGFYSIWLPPKIS